MFSNILGRPDCDVLGEQDFLKRNELKQLVYSLILYTDMAFHNQLFNDFKEIQLSDKSEGNLSFNELKVREGVARM